MRLRPVFEPATNTTTNRSLLPPLHYPSRQQRRVAAARPRLRLNLTLAHGTTKYSSDASTTTYVGPSQQSSREKVSKFSLS